VARRPAVGGEDAMGRGTTRNPSRPARIRISTSAVVRAAPEAHRLEKLPGVEAESALRVGEGGAAEEADRAQENRFPNLRAPDIASQASTRAPTTRSAARSRRAFTNADVGGVVLPVRVERDDHRSASREEPPNPVASAALPPGSSVPTTRAPPPARRPRSRRPSRRRRREPHRRAGASRGRRRRRSRRRPVRGMSAASSRHVLLM